MRFNSILVVFLVCVLGLTSACQFGVSKQRLVDDDGDGIPNGYKVKKFHSKVTIDEDGFENEECLKILTTGKDGYTKVFFPVPELRNASDKIQYYLFVLRAKLSNGAGITGRWRASKGSGKSQTIKFMVWNDTDTSDWLNVRTPIKLKAGAKLTKLSATITGDKSGDCAWIGSYFLMPISKERYKKILDWKVWEELAEAEVNPNMLKGTKKGNLLRNSSFEIGSTGCGYPVQLYSRVTDETAFHGQRSLYFKSRGGLYNGALDSLHYRISPGKLYTFSAWMKARKSGTRVKFYVISDYQWSKNIGDLAADRPGIRKTVKAGLEWKRFSFSFIPEYATKSCVKIFVSGGGDFWLDAMQLEEAGLSDYAPDKALDVGTQCLTEDCIARLGEPVVFSIDVFSPEAKGVDLEYRLSDHWGKIVSNEKETVELKNGSLRKSVKFTPSETGIYKLRVKYSADGNDGVSEERSFGVLPKEAPTENSEDSYFATHIWAGKRVKFAMKSGIKWNKVWHTHWKHIQPKAGGFEWKKSDRAVQWSRDAGFKILGMLDRTPEWARDPASSNPHFPKISEWKKYVYETVSRYKDILYWEVLNEPYYNYTPKEYAEILKATYPVVKKANPKAKVVGICGYLLPGHYMSFVEGVLKEVGTDYMDVASHHGYAAGHNLPELDSPPYDERIKKFKALVKKYGKKEIPIWDSESCAAARTFYDDRLYGGINVLTKGYYRYGRNKSPQDGANWLVRQDIISMALGQKKRFNLGCDYIGTWSQSDIITVGRQSEYTGAPHPIFMAQAALIKELDGARFVKEINISKKVRCYLFQRGDLPVAALWRVAGVGDNREDRMTLAIDVKKLKFVNIMGGVYQCVSGKGDETTILFNGEPLYIEAPGMKAEALGELFEKAAWIPFELCSGKASLLGDNELVVKLINNANVSQAFRFKSPSGSIPLKEQVFKAEETKVLLVPLDSPFRDSSVEVVSDKNVKVADLPIVKKKMLDCPLATGPIVLDGKFKEWSKCGATRLDEDIFVKEGKELWESKEDLSVEVKTCRDAENLYFAIRVNDPMRMVDNSKVSTKRVLHKLYAADSVELFFNPDYTRSLDGRVYQLAFAPADEKEGLKAVWHGYRPSGLSGVEVASFARPGKGYDMEIKVPLKTLGLHGASTGKIMGFDFHVNDRDGAGADRKTMVWSGTLANTSKTDDYGVLLLKD